MRRRYAISTLLEWCLCFACCSASFSQNREPLPPGVEIRARAQPNPANVGDPISVEIDITLPAGYTASIQKPEERVGDFAVLEFSPGPELPEPNRSGQAPSGQQAAGAAAHHRARIVAAVYRTGEFEFPSIPVRIRAANGRKIEASTQPLKIRIDSVLIGKEQTLADLKNQADIPEPIRWFFWLALVAVALLLAALAFWMRRRRRRPPASVAPARPAVDPIDSAEAELRELMARGLPEKGLVKPFYVTFSEIVRKAVESGYGVQTLERTTSEILESLRALPTAGTNGDLDRIESLLLGSDLVKFAKYVPPATEMQAAVKCAFEVFGDCRRARSSSVRPAMPAVESR